MLIVAIVIYQSLAAAIVFVLHLSFCATPNPTPNPTPYPTPNPTPNRGRCREKECP